MFFCFPLVCCSLILPYAENLRAHDCLIFHAFQSRSLVRGRYIGRPSCPNAPWNNTYVLCECVSKWEPQQSIRVQCFIPPIPSQQNWCRLPFPMTLLLVSLRLVGVLGFWGLRTLKLEMRESDDVLRILMLSHAYPRMIYTVNMKWFVGSAFHFNLETRSVTCHTSGHLHFHTTLRYDQILEAVHCGGFTPLLEEKHQWSYGVKPWMVGSPGGTWWRKWWPDQVMKTTQIHQEILGTKSKQSKYPKQSNI